jgi:hypothetical protein
MVLLDALALTVYDESNKTNNVGSRLASMRLVNRASYRAGIELAGRPTLGYALSQSAGRPDASVMLMK